jgi:hypothetical protein
MLLDSGFRNVVCELKPNAFYNFSHRRLMGRAEADPAKPDPDNKRHESGEMEQEFPTTFSQIGVPHRLLSRLPPGLQRTAHRVRSFLRERAKI